MRAETGQAPYGTCARWSRSSSGRHRPIHTHAERAPASAGPDPPGPISDRSGHRPTKARDQNPRGSRPFGPAGATSRADSAGRSPGLLLLVITERSAGGCRVYVVVKGRFAGRDSRCRTTSVEAIAAMASSKLRSGGDGTLARSPGRAVSSAGRALSTLPPRSKDSRLQQP